MYCKVNYLEGVPYFYKEEECTPTRLIKKIKLKSTITKILKLAE